MFSSPFFTKGTVVKDSPKAEIDLCGLSKPISRANSCRIAAQYKASLIANV